MKFDAGLVVEGNPRFSFKIDDALLDSSGKQLAGNLTASDCQKIKLERHGESKPIAFNTSMAGVWTYAGRSHTDLTVSFSNDGFAELFASMPDDQPPAARDRLRRVLVPLHVNDHRIILMVAGTREATGIFRPEGSGPQYHVLSRARAFIISTVGDNLALVPVWSTRDIWEVPGDDAQTSLRKPRNEMLLTRADQTCRNNSTRGERHRSSWRVASVGCLPPRLRAKINARCCETGSRHSSPAPTSIA